ncbi:hypothetical protein FEDK69T_07970 [Flavobacterium enshiense DK69]|uniref:Integrase n=1 Tax=Flavobacterium enshiense DK69 TaxID=1107311 RepID=V6SDL5_9FLAO|nr:site-specific integrase [Flavobacterium enshiense]ESU24352.1 hypothetical protein FEDK69T_07970 [Flavobacterium enshiense DK69]KGO94457.1 integrase [Flavobacterium enshiense DK69]
MATFNIILRNKVNSRGQYPIVLRVTKNRKSKLIKLGYNCDSKDWDEMKSRFKKCYPNYIKRNSALVGFEQKAYSIIEEFNREEVDFTLDQFYEKFKGKTDSNITVLEFWNEKVDDLNTAGRTGNAKAYIETQKSFFKFIKNKNIVFREITPAILDKYEVYLRANNNTDGGIGFKMRELRALFNDAIRKGIVAEKYYPFKLYKVSKLKKGNNKRALTREEVRLIENFDESVFPNLNEAKKLFIFSYYTRGMNFIDMMKLRWENIEGDRIVYTRSKTKVKFVIKILEPVKQILEYYKQVNPHTGYVFPILLREELTPMQIENRKVKKLKKFNSDLKLIAKEVGIVKPITSYVARHSFATNLKEVGVSTDVISQSMGHQSVSITSAYLKDFESEIIDDANEKLLNNY